MELGRALRVKVSSRHVRHSFGCLCVKLCMHMLSLHVIPVLCYCSCFVLFCINRCIDVMVALFVQAKARWADRLSSLSAVSSSASCFPSFTTSSVDAGSLRLMSIVLDVVRPSYADRQLLHRPLLSCRGLWFDQASCGSRRAVIPNMFALGSSSGSCLKAVFSVCIFQYVSSSFLSTSVLDWHYACLQTRNVVETNQCPSAFPLLVVLFVPGPAALAPPCSTRASSLLWMRGSVRAQTYLAGVWLAFGWCLAVVSGDLPRARTRPAGVRLHWLAGGCLCGGPTGTIAEGYNATSTRHSIAMCIAMSC